MNIDADTDRLQQAAKRTLDLLISGLGLLLLSPLLIIITIAIKLDSPGPAIYRHRRIGKDGKPFDLFKFRSMITGGSESDYMSYLKDLIESDENGTGKPYRKMDQDPRITQVGRWLRHSYLDELPQLWNVFKGEMSLVGPRPHVQFEVDHYSPDQHRRLSVRPGITGFWQVFGKADCSFNELIAMDLVYIDQWSLYSDLSFIVRTMIAMARGGEDFILRLSERLPVAKPAEKQQKTITEPINAGD